MKTRGAHTQGMYRARAPMLRPSPPPARPPRLAPPPAASPHPSLVPASRCSRATASRIRRVSQRQRHTRGPGLACTSRRAPARASSSEPTGPSARLRPREQPSAARPGATGRPEHSGEDTPGRAGRPRRLRASPSPSPVPHSPLSLGPLIALPSRPARARSIWPVRLTPSRSGAAAPWPAAWVRAAVTGLALERGPGSESRSGRAISSTRPLQPVVYGARDRARGGPPPSFDSRHSCPGEVAGEGEGEGEKRLRSGARGGLAAGDGPGSAPVRALGRQRVHACTRRGSTPQPPVERGFALRAPARRGALAASGVLRTRACPCRHVAAHASRGQVRAAAACTLRAALISTRPLPRPLAIGRAGVAGVRRAEAICWTECR